MKTCSQCGKTKPTGEFGKHRGGKDGLRAECNACRAEYAKTYRTESAEKIAAYGKKYRAENQEKVAARHKRYLEGHREEHAAYNRRWREEHPAYNKRYNEEHREELAANKKVYGAEHAEEIAAYNRQWYEDNRARAAATRKAWRKANPEKRAEYDHRRRALKAEATIEEFDITEVWERDGEVCAYCGSTENLTIDHIKPLAGGGSHSPDNLTVACRSCNSSKCAKPLISWLAGRERLDLLTQGRLLRR